MLIPGEPYPGDSDQGQVYSLDTQGTIRDEDGTPVRQHEQLQSILASYRRTGGRFRITPRNRFVTRLEKTPEGWRSVYLGTLDQPVEPAPAEEANGHSSHNYSPGDPYPLALARGKVFSVLQRDSRLIARKDRAKVRFVVSAENLTDPKKQEALRQIQHYLTDAYARGHRISKITVTGQGHVVYIFDNQAYFVGHAPEGADGFVFEEKDRTNP